MQSYKIPCTVGGNQVSLQFFIGEPDPKNHPLQNQASWMGKERGATIPADVMESLEKLHEIAKESNLPLDELVFYSLGEAQKVLDDEEAQDIEIEE